MCLVFTLKRFYCRRAITEVSAERPRSADSFVCVLMGKQGGEEEEEAGCASDGVP